MSAKRGPPAHQNSVTWVASRNDKHNSLRKLVAELPNAGVCDKCHKQIEWKKQYGKYRPLKQPAKCVGCGERNVSDAYHALCRPCAVSRGVCAKCQTAAPLHQKQADGVHPRERLPDASELAEMSERERRTALRKVAKAKKERKEAEKAARDAAAGITAAPTADGEEAQSEEEEDELEPMEEEQAPARDLFSAAAADARRKAASVNKAAAAEQPLRTSLFSQPGPPAGPAEQTYAHLATVGHVPAVGGKADASSEACWSDRDLAGRTPTDSVGGGGDDEIMDADAAACAAVEAEAATDDDDDDDDDEDDDAEGEEDGEEGEASAADSDDNEEEGEDQDADGEELRERLECLGHSAGARALVMQHYGWLRPAEHLSIAEAGFDGLCERLTDAGGAEAKAADAMTDRIAHIAETKDDAAMTLAMLLELECYASALPASFAADATEAERACRRLVAGRGASV